MTVNQFLKTISRFKKEWYNNIDNAELVVVTKDKSIGPSSSVQIESVVPGFDWNSGKMLIFTKPGVLKER